MARQSAESASDATRIPVLLTRPEADSRTFAAVLEERFGPQVRPVIAPLIAPRYLAAVLPTAKAEAVIFTSAHGVEGTVRLMPPGARASLPELAYCVGQKTAARARENGFDPRTVCPDAERLVQSILADRPAGPLLHLRGADTRGNIAETLTSHGIVTDSLVVYRQDPVPLDRAGRLVLQHEGPVIAALFSPRTALLFVQSLPKRHKANLWIATLSADVAAVVGRLAGTRLEIAPSPDAAGMLTAIGNLLADRPPP